MSVLQTDAELLSGRRLRADPQAKLDELFLRWLNEDETKSSVVDLLDASSQAADRAAGPPTEPMCAEGAAASADACNTKKRFALTEITEDCEAALVSPSAVKRPRDDRCSADCGGACSGSTAAARGRGGAGGAEQMDTADDGPRRPTTIEARWRSALGRQDARPSGPGPAAPGEGRSGERGGRAAGGAADAAPADEDVCPLCWSFVDATVDSCSAADDDAGSDSYGRIPRFHFPRGRPVSHEFKVLLSRQICSLFPSHDDPSAELSGAEMVRVTTEVLCLASFFAPLVVERIGAGANGGITRAAFQEWFCARRDPSTPPLCACTPEARAFAVLRRDPSRAHLTKDDVLALVRLLVVRHPGLAFLADTPEFQESYALTVVYRIFYAVNRRLDGRLTLRDLERSDLVDACREVDATDDVNAVLRYFSYEHFYVIYCKFCELDGDKDRMITREDLSRYADFSLTPRIVDRVVGGAPLLQWSASHERIGYEDFVYFILSEEDKGTPPAITYWFRCVDVDGDGSISHREMELFYGQQVERMGEAHQDVIQFQDVLCQLIDMIKPRSRGAFHVCDLRRASAGTASVFFNCLFNLNKFFQFEWRDPLQHRLESATSDWERFAHDEYLRLAQAASDDEREENDCRAMLEGSPEELSPVSPACRQLDCDESGSDLDGSPTTAQRGQQLYIDAIDFDHHLRIGVPTP